MKIKDSRFAEIAEGEVLVGAVGMVGEQILEGTLALSIGTLEICSRRIIICRS